MVRKILIVCTIFFATISTAFAIDAATQQHINELQAQIKALEEQAQQYRNAISTQQDKAASLTRDIAILQNQINKLQVELNATGKKIDLTGTQISETEGQISQTQADIDKKHGAIGRLIFFLDQNDQQSMLTSLFKYKDLSSFLSQFHDIAMVQAQLLQIIRELKASRTDLETAKTGLEQQQAQLQALHDQAVQQQQQIGSVKSQKNQVLKDTKGQEALYQKQLVTVQQQESAFFSEMEKLESQVIAGGLFIVHVTASSVPPKGTKLFILPESGARLTQGYGCTSYARCGKSSGPYGGSPHNGLDYAAGFGSPIKAIGAGTIVAHGTNDGWGNWVAIQHPNNLVSLYAHMSAFAPMAVGTAVTQGQVIGYEGKTGKVTGSHVHLSVYKDFFTYLNAKNGQLYFNYFEGTLDPRNYM